MQRANALYAPMYDHIAVHVAGGDADINGVTLWKRTESVPDVHFQPRMVVEVGHTTVLVEESVRLLSRNRDRTINQWL